MANLLANFRNTIILSLVLAAVMIFAFASGTPYPDRVLESIFRWGHVVSGILWIGLLYYFNFVQIRKMPDIPADLKPAISKHIAPEALFWFRWAALATVLFGLALAGVRGYTLQVLTFDAVEGFSNKGFILLGIGIWLAIIMFLNVWGIIWPNQKIALGIKEADADAKAKAARVAMLGSRTNLLLSLPMLTSMAMYQSLFN